jgi:hypothetical protein
MLMPKKKHDRTSSNFLHVLSLPAFLVVLFSRLLGGVLIRRKIFVCENLKEINEREIVI